MKTLNEKDLKFVGSGAYGSYYKIKGNKWGVKVLEETFYTKNEAIDSYKMSSR